MNYRDFRGGDPDWKGSAGPVKRGEEADMADLYDMLQEITDYSHEEKLDLIRESYTALLPAFREIDRETQGLSYVADIIGTAASADGVLDETELAVMRTVMEASDLDLPDDRLADMIRNSGTEDVKKMVYALSDMLDPELRGRIVLLTAGVCSVDDRISEEEIGLIRGLLD